MRPRWTAGQVTASVREMPPACFSPVMAAGIVSRAVDLAGAGRLAAGLLGLAVGGYVVLVAVMVLRLVRCPSEVERDVRDPARVFGFFTFVAASGVLAQRLAGEGLRVVAGCLLVAAVVVWGLLAVGVVAALRSAGARRAVGRADGVWFLCAVGAQSSVLAACALWGTSQPGRAAGLAGWALGVALYVLVAVAVARRLLRGLRPAELTPPYWVGMGAAAIGVVAGAGLLQAGAAGCAPMRPVLRAALLGLWGWATVLLAVLVTGMIWRHVRHRVPLGYELGWWSAVFPLGMYAVAAMEVRNAVGTGGWPHRVGQGLAWSAFGVWLLVGAGLCTACAAQLRRRRSGASPPGGPPGGPPAG